MIFIRRYYLTLSIIMLVGNKLSAQGNIDSFVCRLHNADAISVLAWVAPPKTFDSGRIYIHTLERVLKAENVSSITETYSKYLLISKLVRSLDDTERDWYADLLLYNLTGESSINIISCNTREQWLRTAYNMNITYKDADVEMWHKYLEELPESDKW